MSRRHNDDLLAQSINRVLKEWEPSFKGGDYDPGDYHMSSPTGTGVAKRKPKGDKVGSYDTATKNMGKEWPRKHNDTSAMCDVDEDGVEHEPQGSHESTHGDPDDGHQTELGHDWPKKPKNSGGGVAEPFGGNRWSDGGTLSGSAPTGVSNSGRSQKMPSSGSITGTSGPQMGQNESWTPDSIGSLMESDDDLDLQSLFDSYARKYEMICLEDFQALCHAHGCKAALDEQSIVNLMRTNREFIFYEGVDANGYYWTPTPIAESTSTAGIATGAGSGFKKPWEDDDEDCDEDNEDCDTPVAESRRQRRKTISELRMLGPSGESDDGDTPNLDDEELANQLYGNDGIDWTGLEDDDDLDLEFSENDAPNLDDEELSNQLYSNDDIDWTGLEDDDDLDLEFWENEHHRRNRPFPAHQPEPPTDSDYGMEEPYESRITHSPAIAEGVRRFMKSARNILENNREFSFEHVSEALGHSWDNHARGINPRRVPTKIRKTLAEMAKRFPRFGAVLENSSKAMDKVGGTAIGTGGVKNSSSFLADQPGPDDMDDLGEPFGGKQTNTLDGTPEMKGTAKGMDGKGSVAQTVKENVAKLSRHVQRSLRETKALRGKYKTKFAVKIVEGRSQNRTPARRNLAEALLDAEELLQFHRPEDVDLEATFSDKTGSVILKRDIPLLTIKPRGLLTTEGTAIFRFNRSAETFAESLVDRGVPCQIVGHNWGRAVKAKVAKAIAESCFKKATRRIR